MKIAYSHQIFCDQKFGGISRYFFELANRLASLGDRKVQCRIVCPLYINKYLRHASPALQLKGISVPAFRRTGLIYRTVNKLLSPLYMAKWRPDVLHETYYSNSNVAPHGCRIVITVYDMIHELFPEYFSPSDPTLQAKRLAVARADHIICISEQTRQDLIRLLGVSPEKTTVVYLGFSLTQTKPIKLQEMRRPFLLYVGQRGYYKNFHRLLSAYASCPRLHETYDLVAFGGGGFTEEEQELIINYGLNETQVRQKSGDDAMLNALYKQAAMFIYPSLYEGFGIPPLEAMSFDCPVVCSNTSSIPEVVGDAAIQFDPYQVESIAEAMVTVAANPALQAHLRQRGRIRLQNFSWDKCAQETLNVYKRVLA